MKGTVDRRTVILGEYIVENKATVRDAAKSFGISKSTVHKDVSKRLKSIDPKLYTEVKSVLDVNKAQRHIRGGPCSLFFPHFGVEKTAPSAGVVNAENRQRGNNYDYNGHRRQKNFGCEYGLENV